MTTIERRFTAGLVELRKAGDAPRIGGYAARFGKLSRNLGGFVEIIDPTAFNRSHGRDWPDVVARYNHDDAYLLGSIAGRTLSLAIDENGLRYEVQPPAHRADVVELVERGDISSSSFAFRSAEDEWETTDQGYPLRRLRSLDLVDVAPVVSPAYPDATAGLRSLAQKFDADLDEVRSLAQADELRKFFRATGPQAAKQTFGAAARMELLAKRDA